MDYKLKYLKYKMKYLNLLGGVKKFKTNAIKEIKINPYIICLE